jgi:RNA polymerase sigma-70 factor (ECF subfamily)
MNREEFVQLVKGEQAELRRFLLALCCGNTALADDIAQDSLVKAYLSSQSYSNNGRFKAWIYKIAYRTFLDYRKKIFNYTNLEQATGLSDEATNSDNAFQYQELYDALNQLNEKERTSILLFYIKGYSIKEISMIIDTSEDAVKKQLSRGREHLKTKMKL